MNDLDLVVHLRHCSKDSCKYGDSNCPLSSEDSIIALPEGVDYNFTEEDTLKEDLKKAILKLPSTDGTVELYKVLEAIEQVFKKDLE